MLFLPGIPFALELAIMGTVRDAIPASGQEVPMQRNVEKFGFNDKRDRTRTSTDPYLPDAGGKEPALCQSCQAIYRQKRWQLDPALVGKLATDSEVHWVTCPACQKIS